MISSALVQFECAGMHLVRNKWFHLVALVTRTKQALYANRKLVRIVVMPNYANNSCVFKKHLVTNEMISKWGKEKTQLPHTLHIGTKRLGCNFWLGEIGNVSIWNRHLGPHKIAAIYEQNVTIDKVNIGEYIMARMSMILQK